MVTYFIKFMMKKLTSPQKALLDLINKSKSPVELYFARTANMAKKLAELGLIELDVNELNQCFASKINHS